MWALIYVDSQQRSLTMTNEPPTATRRFLELTFIIPTAILALSAFVIGPHIIAKGEAGVREPLPLTAPLNELQKSKLAPYTFNRSNTLTAAVEEALGTDQYIDWALTDTTIKDHVSPLRNIRLFITYYTGGRELVPHTPDICYLGAGYQPVKKEDIDVYLDSLATNVPIRAITFEKSQVFGGETPTVIYLFACNGDYVSSRDGVRFRVNSPGSTYAYFSKIEITFGTPQSRPQNPTREEAIEAATRLLNVVLPLLSEHHFPDWHAAEAAAKKRAEQTVN